MVEDNSKKHRYLIAVQELLKKDKNPNFDRAYWVKELCRVAEELELVEKEKQK